jgi:radical S-adenosyl methionine domain-containing protein 2
MDTYSINFHLWSKCNMRCAYCFNRGGIPNIENISKQRQEDIVKVLGSYRISKLSFVGGEPTLCPWLEKLALLAKESGVGTTMLITNGLTLANRHRVLKYFDWVGISIDSFKEDSNKQIGRLSVNYQNTVSIIKDYGCRLKINTVVSSTNKNEHMIAQIEDLKPERWKILQVLKIANVNGSGINNFLISGKEFNEFIKNNLSEKVAIIAEKCYQMRDSYIMLDPHGYFFSNSDGFYKKSKRTILEAPLYELLEESNFKKEAFLNRGGDYDWERS